MKRSDMIRLLTAFINLNTGKTIDEFSGDFLCTLDEGEKVLNFIEEMGMLPPEYNENEGYSLRSSMINEWESEDG